jgi:hypothetical protein
MRSNAVEKGSRPRCVGFCRGGRSSSPMALRTLGKEARRIVLSPRCWSSVGAEWFLSRYGEGDLLDRRSKATALEFWGERNVVVGSTTGGIR